MRRIKILKILLLTILRHFLLKLLDIEKFNIYFVFNLIEKFLKFWIVSLLQNCSINILSFFYFTWSDESYFEILFLEISWFFSSLISFDEWFSLISDYESLEFDFDVYFLNSIIQLLLFYFFSSWSQYASYKQYFFEFIILSVYTFRS